MELVAILIYVKNHIVTILLSIVIIYLLGLLLYLIIKDVFGVNRFKNEFSKVFKPIKKKQRKNKEIKSEETSKVLEEIKNLHIMHDKIIVSLDNAQHLNVKDNLKYKEKLKKTFDKLVKFEKYISTYHEQINTYYNIKSVPVRVADKLKEFDEIWR